MRERERELMRSLFLHIITLVPMPFLPPFAPLHLFFKFDSFIFWPVLSIQRCSFGVACRSEGCRLQPTGDNSKEVKPCLLLLIIWCIKINFLDHEVWQHVGRRACLVLVSLCSQHLQYSLIISLRSKTCGLYRAIFSNKRISFPLSYPFLYNYYNTPQLKFILGYLDITSRLSFGWIMVHRIFTLMINKFFYEIIIQMLTFWLITLKVDNFFSFFLFFDWGEDAEIGHPLCANICMHIL